MTFRPFTLAVTALLLVSTPVVAQTRHFGLAGGMSQVAGGSMIMVDFGSFAVTGASKAGYHVRGWFAAPLGTDHLTFQGELFYNRHTSDPNTFRLFGDSLVQMALIDRTMGVMGNLALDLAPRARISPRVTMGMGVMSTQVWSNPNPASAEATLYRSGTAIGIQTGVGFRLRAGRIDLLLDGRFVQPLGTNRGTAFWPVTLGVGF